jgi:hypothetical protein
MFSMRRFTSAAMRAISRTPSSVNSSSTFSAPISAWYCRTSAFFGSCQDADEVLLRERLQLDADREPALQLGDQVARLGDVERAGGDEQDVVRADHAVLRLHGAALDDGQQVALHALAADVGAGPAALAGDLVDLVEEDDAHVLGPLERLVHDLVHVDELVELVLQQDAARLGHGDRAALLPLRHHVLQHLGDVVHALGRPWAASCSRSWAWTASPRRRPCAPRACRRAAACAASRGSARAAP